MLKDRVGTAILMGFIAGILVLLFTYAFETEGHNYERVNGEYQSNINGSR